MKRKRIQNTQKNTGQRISLNGQATHGSVRTGMYQGNSLKHIKHAAVFQSEPVRIAVDDALNIPEMLEEMIPSESGEVPESVEISADETVTNMLETKEPETEEEKLTVDYSGERIPVLEPVCGGIGCSPHELVYDRGDGRICRIPDPLGVLTEEGLYPFFPEVKNPSANVPAAISNS